MVPKISLNNENSTIIQEQMFIVFHWSKKNHRLKMTALVIVIQSRKQLNISSKF